MQMPGGDARGVASEAAPGANAGGPALAPSGGPSTERGRPVNAIGELVSDWIETLHQVEGRGDRTCRSYRGAVSRFLEDLELEHVSELTRAAVERHVKRLALAGVGRSRLASVIVAIRAFCRWLVGHRLLDRNPLLELRAPRPYRKAKRPLTVDEVKRLLLGGGGGLPRSRDELISTVAFAVAYGGALRPGEIGSLRLTDVEWHEDELMFTVLLRHAKHAEGDQRQPLGVPVSRLLGAYLQLRPQLAGGPWLFPGKGDRPLTERAVTRLFEELVARRGIPAKGRAMTPKILRTSRCTHLLNEGNHPKWVQRFMRHRSVETTMDHYSWVDDDSSLRMLRRRDPLLGRRAATAPVQGAFRLLLEELSRRPDRPLGA